MKPVAYKQPGLSSEFVLEVSTCQSSFSLGRKEEFQFCLQNVHHDHWNQHQCAQLSVNESSLPSAIHLVHIDKSGVRKFYVFLLWLLVVHIPQNHLLEQATLLQKSQAIEKLAYHYLQQTAVVYKCKGLEAHRDISGLV